MSFTGKAYSWKTAYEWCLELNIRPLNLTGNSEEDFFMTKVLNDDEFTNFIQRYTVKPNSMPRKPEKYLELRMYGFVPYNIAEIQKGIQFGHAVVEYGMKNMNTPEYQIWANEWKTFIILNGGNSCNGQLVRQGYKTQEYVGMLDSILYSLRDNDIRHATFVEPDLGMMLSAVVFLVDERVFNKVLYPDFKSHPYPWLEKNRNARPTPKQEEEWNEINNINYAAWVDKIGGVKNVFLRELLKDRRLA